MPITLSALLLISAIGAGTYADRVPVRRVRIVGEYRILAADFHIHSSMWSDGTLTPWGIVLEAERAGLDAIAVTAHNEVIDAKLARWFSRLTGGPAVLVGEEVLAGARYHLIAVGIQDRVSFQQPAARAIDDIHRQGGVAIAAHPTPDFTGWDAGAMSRLDGTEICHPLVYARDGGTAQLEAFAARGSFAAIGSSDFHGLGAIGACRTYVFVTDPTPAAILDAIRSRRTVVYGRDGTAYGDPALIPLAERAGLREASVEWKARGSAAEWWSRAAGIIGLLGVIVSSRRQQAA